MRSFAGFNVTWDYDWMRLWCPRCPEDAAPVWLFGDNPTGMAEILEVMVAHNSEHNAAQEPMNQPNKENHP